MKPADINKRADAKIQEAQKKRAEYDNEKVSSFFWIV